MTRRSTKFVPGIPKGEARTARPEAGASQPLTRFARSYVARATDRGWIRRADYFLLLLTLGGGFALRVNRLGVQSLWNDEGTSIALAHLSLPAILDGAAHDIHPPLYYLFLHLWMAAAGESEFAVRFLSVLAGALLIAVTFRLARLFFDEEVALTAALLSALSAFQLYYSQETRMYMPVALWSAASVWAMVVALRAPFGRGALPWLFYVLATLAALYTHYFAFTLVIFENLAFLAWFLLSWRDRRHTEKAIGESSVPGTQAGQGGGLTIIFGYWVVAQIVIALAFLPWLAFAGNQLTTWPAISQPLSPLDLVTRVLSAFVFKIDMPIGAESWIVVTYGVLFLVGLLPSLDLFKHSLWGIVLFALWTLVPLAAMFVVSLQRPAYDPKFLLLATPGFFILAARGLSILNPGLFLRERGRSYSKERSGVMRSVMTWQWLLTVGIVASGALIGARDVYYDPRLQRDDYRGIATYINTYAMVDDVVLIDAPGQIQVFRYYYHGAATVQTLPIGRPLQLEATRAALDDMVAQYRNLYAVYWGTDQSDPANVVESYLSTHAFKASEAWHGDVRFAEYALPRAFAGGGAESIGARFGGEIELVEYSIGARLIAPGESPRVRSVSPGTILPINLVWFDLARPSDNYKVFVHLLNAQGKIVSQRDTEPVSGFRPTGTWNVGEKISDPTAVLIPAGTPAGDYSIELGLYRPEDGTRLRLESGDDHLVLDPVRVQE